MVTKHYKIWLAAVIVIAAAFIFWQHLAAGVMQRDAVRRADITKVGVALAAFQSAHQTFPSGAGERTQQQVTGGLAVLPELPRPPGSRDSYEYVPSADGKFYVACTRLEGNYRRDAFFENQAGTFTAPASGCSTSAKPEIADFVTADTMTYLAVQLFYQADPEIVTKPFIQQTCAGSAEGQLIGCYNGRIFVLQLDRPEIVSEMDVTAAHELLHAVWATLSKSEQSRLGSEIDAQAKQINDPELTKHLEGYDPSVRTEELHSVLGTEYGNLSSALETHYKKYFANRQAILAQHQRYTSQIDGLKAEIDRMRNQLDDLDRRAKAFLAAGNIAAYNSLVDPYNSLVRDINQQIDRYNALTAHTRPESAQQNLPTR